MRAESSQRPRTKRNPGYCLSFDGTSVLERDDDDRNGVTNQIVIIDDIVYNLCMNVISLEEAARYTGLSAQTLKVQADRGRLGARRAVGLLLLPLPRRAGGYRSQRQCGAGFD